MQAAIATARTIILDTLVNGQRTALAALRPALEGITREAQDAALKALQADGQLVLYRDDNQAALSQADNAAALQIAGFPRHYVYLTNRTAGIPHVG